MRWVMGLLAATIATVPVAAAVRSAAARDVEGYAVATCLAAQADPVLKQQGEGWASAIIERGRGGVEQLRPVQLAVARALAQSGVAVMRQDGPRPSDLALPAMTCGEIVDRPVVRAAVDGAVARLGAAYRR